MVTYAPSKYQQNIFDAIREKRGSLSIQAVAGSGKTTTIVEAAKLISYMEPAIFLAFNKSIATELGQKLPEYVPAMTFHSFGFRALKGIIRYTKPNQYKVGNIVREMDKSGMLDATEYEDYADGVVKLVSLAKNAGIDAGIQPNTVESWLDLVDHYDVKFQGDDIMRAIEIAREVLNVSNADLTMIDFDDMLYLTIKLNAKIERYSWIFIDECQDTNGIQREIIRRMHKADSKLIAVGDVHQAIYGFRGADAEAMQLLSAEFNCTPMPLSISYRCPRAVVLEAQSYVEGIEASDTAIEGSVDTLDRWHLSQFSPTDAILCRNTAPLVSLAYKLVANGQGVRIVGRDFGKGLITLIGKLTGKKEMTLAELATKLDAWEQSEIAMAISRDQPNKAEGIADKAESLRVSIEGMPQGATIMDLIAKIEFIFQDRAGLLTLSTMHRAKGLEWDTVYILNRHLLPSKWAKQEWQQTQEHNLGYVAVTRAKRNLFYISTERMQ